MVVEIDNRKEKWFFDRLPLKNSKDETTVTKPGTYGDFTKTSNTRNRSFRIE